MANNDNGTQVTSESSSKKVNEQGSAPLGGMAEASENTVTGASKLSDAVQGAPEETSVQTSAMSNEALKPSTSSPSPLVSSPSTGAIAPQLKKFSSVNINKKFLEKNSTHTSTTSASSSVSSKPAGPVARPALAPAAHPSRLVTAKLTATVQPSTTTGPGWSRPSSVAPTAPPSNGVSSQPPLKSSGPPALPHPGKVIQPQPRAAAQAAHDLLHPTKPAWGRVNNAAREEARMQSDFPTAAEVALGSRLAVRHPPLETSAATAASNQARAEEADTFRGVHLDPNAHHWDEMEEDDNFLDAVVEFEDGRRYEVETAPAPSKPATPPTQLFPPLSNHVPDSKAHPRDLAPISKEERFADDFDRSWPRTSPSLSSVSGQPATLHPATSPKSPAAPSHPATSDSSRVLFNERSNRLEPYSNAHRPGSGPYPKRSFDGSSEARLSVSGVGNVQVLQKHDRSRLQVNGVPQRDLTKRDSYGGPPTLAFPGPGGKPAYAPTASSQMETRVRRISNMGPPPVPAHAIGRGPPSSRDGLSPRQAWTAQPNAFIGRVPSRDAKARSIAPSSSGASIRHPSRSPVLSHASAALSTPAPAVELINLPPNTDIDELRKDVMQTAAARAKQRRQEEEAEREKERERAKQKATELEARMRAAAEASERGKKEAEAVSFIEESVKSIEELHVPPPADMFDFGAPSPPPYTTPRRPSFTDRPSFSERPSVSRRSSAALQQPPSGPSDKVESWRSHAAPLPPPALPHPSSHHGHPRPRKPSIVASSAPPFEQPEPVKEEPEVVLEVVEFSDLGKYVGETEAVATEVVALPAPVSVAEVKVLTHSPPSAVAPVVPPSSIASQPPAQPPSKADTGPWRRKDPLPPAPIPRSTSQTYASTESGPSTESMPHNVAPESTTYLQKPPPRPQYKEAAMSALDDAMSRIKGALDGMQAHEAEHHLPVPIHSKKQVVPAPQLAPSAAIRDRWKPPALRHRRTSDFEISREPFYTVPEPPLSPKPVWNTFTVRLPTAPKAAEPVTKKQLAAFSRLGQVRWDILSFNPPVEGMGRRDFSVDNVIFRTSANYKGKVKYRVSLPKQRSRTPRIPLANSHPTSKVVGSGAFGKPSSFADASTWRHAVVETGGDSCSSVSLQPTSTPLSPPRKMQPKMPAGSAVAFYRDSKLVNAEEAEVAVNFIVTSELEEQSQPLHSSPEDASTIVNSTTGSQSSPSDSSIKDSSNLSEGLVSPWLRSSLNLGLKESAARGPDPEHLKALWSSTNHTSSELQPINSLEGIADDLTSVPFTLQDVKSEDGETPPPSIAGSAPSRMSLHDVTRAFQQVPSSTSTTPHRPSISPPTTNAPVARPPPNYTYGVPMPPQTHNQNMRSPFPSYPSPMMSHSPAPVVYPQTMTNSPVPNRMQVNGHNSMAPMYPPPPVWVPVSGTNTPGGQPPMMRPAYPHMISYSPNAQPMYLPSPNMAAQPNANGSRGRNMSAMMSPGVVHASPNMYGSPVLLPAVLPGRGQMCNDSNPPHGSPAQNHAPGNPYSSPSNSFMRPAAW